MRSAKDVLWVMCRTLPVCPWLFLLGLRKMGMASKAGSLMNNYMQIRCEKEVKSYRSEHVIPSAISWSRIMCTKAWFGHGLEDASDVSDADALTIEGALYFQHFASSKALTSHKTRASSECGPGRSTGWHCRAWCDYAPGPKISACFQRHDSLTPVVTQNNNVDSSTLKFSKSLLISNKGLWGVVVVPCLGAMAA